MRPADGGLDSFVLKVLAGAVAGALGAAVCNPTDVLKVCRLQYMVY